MFGIYRGHTLQSTYCQRFSEVDNDLTTIVLDIHGRDTDQLPNNWVGSQERTNYVLTDVLKSVTKISLGRLVTRVTLIDPSLNVLIKLSGT